MDTHRSYCHGSIHTPRTAVRGQPSADRRPRTAVYGAQSTERSSFMLMCAWGTAIRGRPSADCRPRTAIYGAQSPKCSSCWGVRGEPQSADGRPRTAVHGPQSMERSPQSAVHAGVCVGGRSYCGGGAVQNRGPTAGARRRPSVCVVALRRSVTSCSLPLSAALCKVSRDKVRPDQGPGSNWNSSQLPSRQASRC